MLHPCAQILDPTRPLDENLDRISMDYNWLPPELDPTAFPEFLLQANNPIAQFEHQVGGEGEEEEEEHCCMQKSHCAVSGWILNAG